jgi:hypothetical protein
MKYITTDKHPEFKKGVEIKFDDEILTSGYGVYYEENFTVSHYTVKKEFKKHWIEKEYVKKKEPKFTKDDMIEFAQYYRSGYIEKVGSQFNRWKNQRK